MSSFAYPGQPPSEMELLRRRAEFAESELRRIEVESAQMAIAQRDKIQREADERAAAEREAAEASALEEHRRNSWFNDRLSKAIAAGDEPLALFLRKTPDQHKADAPKEGWPVGVSPDDFRHIPLGGLPDESDDVAATALGQALAYKGVHI